jgi:hypothetical protein
MGLARRIFNEVGRLTDVNNWGRYKDKFLRHQLESFHRAVEERAYFAARKDGFEEPQEVYWDAAKGSVALEIAGTFEGCSWPRFKPGKAILPIDEQDAEIIYSVLRFPDVRTNEHASIYGKVMDYIKAEYEKSLKRK